MLDLLDEKGNHFDTSVRCSLERFCRETLGVGQLVERFPRIVFPSFSAPVVTVCRSRFGLHPNSGNRRERNTLTSVSDKQLM